MLLPISWLKAFFPKLPTTPKLVETLMMHGLDVEDVKVGNTFEHVVVGEIVAIKPHPNADKLRLADVVIEPNGAPQEIVCGAPNIEVGQKVPVALVGAKLPNGITIEPRAIRGVTSNGMICAEDELGLGQGQAGVLVLNAKLKAGMPLSQAIGSQEVIDLAIPANRADLMAMRGLAWEIGAMLNQEPKLPIAKYKESNSPAKKSVTLKISDAKLCPVFTVRVIRGVTMKPTPIEIVNRLRAAGMRSVNIIADITNYVMLEYGQPLHAYNASNVKGQTLIVRQAKHGESLKTLDSKTRALDSSMLVVADAERVVGLAGVMGGKDTEVTDATTDILLEAAIFDPVSIRKTSRQLGLISEASKRFEKGLWPSLPERASAAAAAMMVQLCGGTIEQGIVEAGVTKRKPTVVKMNPAYISERLGVAVPSAKAKSILTMLGFSVKGTAKAWVVTVPEWRIDVTLPEDIVDEIGRMVGYEKLPKEIPANVEKKELPQAIRFKEEVKNILVEIGLTEIISHAFYSTAASANRAGQHYEIANPLDKTQHFLRKSLLPQLSEVLKHQADAGEDAAVFEIGRVFDPAQKGNIENQQRWKLAIGFAQKPTSSDPLVFSDASQKLFEKLYADFDLDDSSGPEDIFRGRRLKYGELDLAELMKKSKATFGTWDPKQHISKNVKYKEQSKYPAVKRDISMFFEKKQDASHILDVARKSLGEHIEIVKLLLTYSTFQSKTNWLLKLTFQSPDRTLTKPEVDKFEQKIKDALMEHGAVIR